GTWHELGEGGKHDARAIEGNIRLTAGGIALRTVGIGADARGSAEHAVAQKHIGGGVAIPADKVVGLAGEDHVATRSGNRGKAALAIALAAAGSNADALDGAGSADHQYGRQDDNAGEHAGLRTRMVHICFPEKSPRVP